MQLRHDHPFSTVDDERAFFGHQGHFAHVNLLLFHFLDDLGLRRGRLAVINDQLNPCAYGGCKRQTTSLALTHIECRLGQVVLDKLHLDETIVRNNGERGFESGLQTLAGAFFGCHIRLQKCGVSIFLHLEQIGNGEYVLACPETLSDALAFGI